MYSFITIQQNIRCVEYQISKMKKCLHGRHSPLYLTKPGAQMHFVKAQTLLLSLHSDETLQVAEIKPRIQQVQENNEVISFNTKFSKLPGRMQCTPSKTYL